MLELTLYSESNRTPYVLIAYRGNWGDEMDIKGGAIDTYESWDITRQSVKEYFDNHEDGELINSLGNGRDIKYDSFDSWDGDYNVYSLPFDEETIEVLKRVLRTLWLSFYWPEWKEDEDIPEDDEGIETIDE